jgi:hypothetical protein
MSPFTTGTFCTLPTSVKLTSATTAGTTVAEATTTLPPKPGPDVDGSTDPIGVGVGVDALWQPADPISVIAVTNMMIHLLCIVFTLSNLDYGQDLGGLC